IGAAVGIRVKRGGCPSAWRVGGIPSVVFGKTPVAIISQETFMTGASGSRSTVRKTLANTTRLMPFSLVDA
ncbi:hypothetical protein, partial [Nonomuraea mesophila]|uniref:hypothetical protein n=1 Tax=Nonomuraea mesophila TaxID=2530382 RepID=UPI001C708842